MTAGPQSFSVPAPAKINLYLHVTGLRPDGYHALDSLIVFADVHDTLRLAPAEDLSLIVEGPHGEGLSTDSENLVIKAADRLREAAGIETGAHMVLEKNLPVASGIGGGSADCAAALTGLARLWNVDTGAVNLAQLGLTLGADVPVCLFGRAAFMSGIGEEITNAPALPPAWLVLVNPGAGLSTPDVFEARRQPQCEKWSQPGRFEKSPATVADFADLLKGRNNDLTDAAIGLQPVIGDVLQALEGADGVLLTRMSGSGATCFGLFKDPMGAEHAAVELFSNHPQWWVRWAPLLTDKATLTG
jgi:4-diphosphocytidyl-2-C-methyl-D-erythritol kinase